MFRLGVPEEVFPNLVCLVWACEASAQRWLVVLIAVGVPIFEFY